jgi:hypothetical protein
MWDIQSLKLGSKLTAADPAAVTVHSTSPAVASATLAQGVITLTALAAGNTVITILDASGALHVLPITVTA